MHERRGQPDSAVRDRARELGVTEDVLERLQLARHDLVREVAAAPRTWGFDLLAAGAVRRDVVAELRARARVQGMLAESYLAGHAALLELVPDPPTLPAGGRLDEALTREGRLESDAAHALSRGVRAAVQSRLGRALDLACVEQVVRDVAWDLDLEPAAVLPRALRILQPLL